MSSEFEINGSFQSDRRSPARFVWSHVMRHKLVAVTMIVGGFSNAALASALMVFLGLVFDILQDDANTDKMSSIIPIIVLIVLSQLSRAVLQLMRNFSSEVFAQRIERDVRDELYASLLGKSMAFHDSKPVGDIMARVTNDVRELNFMMNPGFNMVIGSGFFLLLPLLIIPFTSLELLLVPLVFVVVHVITQYRFVASLHPIAENVRRSFGNMNARLAEALDGLQVVKGTAQEKQEGEYFSRLVNDWAKYYIQQGMVEARYLPYLWLGLAFAVGFMHAMLMYQRGVITQGDIVNYMGQLGLFGFPVFASLFALSRIASGYASAERILSIINDEMTMPQKENPYRGTLKGRVTFENVDFGYAEGQTILRNITFSVEAGKTVAIVGQTGAGKTTIAKLLNRTYDTTKGRVLIDDVDVRDWDIEQLRSQISVIEQDIFLFSRTIAQNIAFGTDDANQAEIVAAAKKAQAHEFIESFPEGYETVVGQRGVTLSGGQRQRLAIARAFHSDPPILILDDSTSAIDSATEDRIQKAIWNAAKGRTTLLITHRLSQIRWADHIIVLKQGTIVAQGSHDELLESSEAYQRIFARYETPTKQPDLEPALPQEV